MKISFITTVYNEEKTIIRLLDSIISQIKLPNEIIIVDGGSNDKTVEVIKKYHLKKGSRKIIWKVIVKQGNRSVGRNEAIKVAKGEVIVCSDAGNILDIDWIKNITKPFKDKKVDVVAGYYKGKANTVFQKSIIPYALVMEDKVDPNNFLPATRSVAFKKSIWKKIGGFNESFSHNEDYVFARKLKENGAKIIFAKDAIVYWLPRSTFKQAFIMLWRFAYGDSEAKILRTNVLLLFARYTFGFYFLFLCLLYRSIPSFLLAILFLLLYVLWSIKKNYRYVKNRKALYILPMLQFTADAAVILGTLLGLLKRIVHFNYLHQLKQHKFLYVILFIYVFIESLTLNCGIPNQNHPFPYHMDEWHQLQAVANTFRYGTPNMAGSANGTLFHFLTSGLYLVPFTVFNIIDPFSLQLDNSFMRERVFELLRINTILWGVFSIAIIYSIAGKIKASKKLAIFLFTFNPIWLMLSGYFKYDIDLLFWILLSFWFLVRFSRKPNNQNILMAAVPVGFAIAVKVSAVPLVGVYIFSYFLFHRALKNDFKYLLYGTGIIAAIILLFGMPDTLFGRGNTYKHIFENIITIPNTSSNYNLGMDTSAYLFLKQYPVIFGHSLILLFYISFFGLICISFKKFMKRNIKEYKMQILIAFSLLVFILSILPLKTAAFGNKNLVILPFLVLIISTFFRAVPRIAFLKTLIIGFLSLTILVQSYESFVWVMLKLDKNPRVTSSEWLIKNVNYNETIGIENNPIYQSIPDIIQKEYYYDQYKIKNTNLFKYKIIESKSMMTPQILIVADEEIEPLVHFNTQKRALVKTIRENGYKKQEVFITDLKNFSFFGNKVDFYLTGPLVSTPLTISIYKK